MTARWYDRILRRGKGNESAPSTPSPSAQLKSQSGGSKLYKRLNLNETEIRLVQIDHPLPHQDEIQCTMTTFRLDRAPKFLALSYAWVCQDNMACRVSV